MPPAEKHILEIDSAELAFGERRILSGVYLLVETGGVTAVLGRNGCGKSCLMKILSGSLKAGFCSMRIDGKWHRRFTEKEIRYLPQHPEFAADKSSLECVLQGNVLAVSPVYQCLDWRQ